MNASYKTKTWLFILPILLLTSCGGQSIAPTEPPTSTATDTPTATITPTSTATPTATPTPTETPIPCFTLLEPEDAAELDRTTGQLTFAWTEQYGAAGYRFAITIPSGYVEEKDLAETSFERWLEGLPLGGEYVWAVEALDGEGVVICTAGPYTFIKSEYVEINSGNNSGNGGEDSSHWCEPWPECDGDGGNQ